MTKAAYYKNINHCDFTFFIRCSVASSCSIITAPSVSSPPRLLSMVQLLLYRIVARSRLRLGTGSSLFPLPRKLYSAGKLCPRWQGRFSCTEHSIYLELAWGQVIFIFARCLKF